MRKAGFTPAAELSFDPDRQVRLAPLGAHARARAAADLLGLPRVVDPLAPCWCCQSRASAACWPEQESSPEACTCAIERKPAALLAA
jgi:hypothetical protein